MLTILPPPETQNLEIQPPNSGHSGADRRLKICDLTQFYSPLSGGVKRYLEEKRKYASRAGIDHLLVVPGERSECIASPEGKTFFIKSPLVARKSRYRALLNLNAVEEILEREKPHIIESSDPYQLAWKAIASGEALRIPIVAFYHSHFPEAYIRTTTKYLGESATRIVMEIAKDYTRNLYNRFKYTFVPSVGLAQVLADWGVGNVCLSELGVDTQVFKRIPDRIATRAFYGIPQGKTVLLYVGRLAAEKNVKTLFQAFELLHEGSPGRYHLLIVGNGSYRDIMQHLQTRTGALTWLPYCSDQNELAKIYRAADLFVHPSVQETFGLVALESQSCGTPVVGIRGSYMDRIIFADQSHWSKENTPLSLTKAIEEISRTDLESAGAQASCRVAERYSWNQVFNRMFDIYHQLAI